MKKYTLYAITAAGSAMFAFSMLLLANAVVNTLRGDIPVITLHNYCTEPDTVVSVSDLCSWERLPGMYITSANWQDGDPALPVISNDQQSILLGEKCGILEVTVADAPDIISPDATVTVTVEQQP